MRNIAQVEKTAGLLSRLSGNLIYGYSHKGKNYLVPIPGAKRTRFNNREIKLL